MQQKLRTAEAFDRSIHATNENSDTCREAILRRLDGMRGINTHCHHLPDAQFSGVDLKFLYDHSYCDWMDSYPADASAVPDFLLRNCGNSYFYWLQTAIATLYGLPVSGENLDKLNLAIADAYRDETHHLRILEQQCRYEKILLDNCAHPGWVESAGKLFVPVLRCNMFVVCNCKTRKDHNGNNPSMYLPGIYDQDFDGYLEAVKNYVLQHRIFKFAIAYDEGNRIGNFDKARAAAAYGQEHPTPEAYRDFYGYMVYYICRLAGENGQVVQFHTGLGRMNDTSAIFLRPLIEALPDTRFDLFHGGYPWMDDMLGLLHNYPNVYADLCWLPLISTSAAKRFLREALEIGGAHRLLWGCDTWTSEESFGATLAFRRVVSEVLAQMHAEGYLSCDEACYIAGRIWRGNAAALYGFEGSF